MVVSITIFEGLQASDWTGITSIFLVLNYQIILLCGNITTCHGCRNKFLRTGAPNDLEGADLGTVGIDGCMGTGGGWVKFCTEPSWSRLQRGVTAETLDLEHMLHVRIKGGGFTCCRESCCVMSAIHTCSLVAPMSRSCWWSGRGLLHIEGNLKQTGRGIWFSSVRGFLFGVRFPTISVFLRLWHVMECQFCKVGWLFTVTFQRKANKLCKGSNRFCCRNCVCTYMWWLQLRAFLITHVLCLSRSSDFYMVWGTTCIWLHHLVGFISSWYIAAGC